MADGRGITTHFTSPPPDREAKQRRLEMLVSTFGAVVDEATHGRKSRANATHSLPDELAAFCARAAAINAVVIDANSPVVWGAAQPQGVIVLRPRSSSPGITLTGAPVEEEREPEPRPAILSRRALHIVRSLPELTELRKGRHLHYVDRQGDVPLLAQSFAGIYVLVVVFDGPFDEIRAERAIVEALPRIERLVMALPPLDPAPQAGVVALRRSNRRR
jgi:hypothetical protein